jgi:ribosome-associated protein
MPASKSVTELTQVAARAAAEKFGTEMIAIDLSDQMVLSEVFLIVTGANIRQVDAIADEVEEKLRLIGEKPARREGTDEWVLLDYSDLVGKGNCGRWQVRTIAFFSGAMARRIGTL